MHNKGFTIIELVIVLGLCAIIAATLMPIAFRIYINVPYLRQREVAVQNVRRILLSNISRAEQKKVLTEGDPVLLSVTGASSQSLSASTSKYSFSTDVTDWYRSMGSNTCNVDSNNKNSYGIISSYIFPSVFEIADIDILNGYVYIVGKSNDLVDADLYILNVINPKQPLLVSKKRFSPGGLGFTAVHATENYLYVSNRQTRIPFVVIDTKNKNSPHLAYQYIISTSTNLTGYGFGNTLHYYDKRLYLGLTKSTSSELYVFSIDASLYPISSPVLLGEYETNTQINSLIAKGSTLFVSTPEQKQVRILDVVDPQNIFEKSFITASGYAVQDARTLFLTGSTLFVGRTVGGFDNTNNHELFAYNVLDEAAPKLLFSKNIGSSVNRIIVDHGQAFIFIGAPNMHLGIYNVSSTSTIETKIFVVSDSVGAVDCEDDVVAVVSAHGRRIDFISH